MAHSDVTFDIESRCSRKAKGLHVRIDQCVIHVVGHAPSALETRDELLVYRAAMVINQLNFLVGTVVGVTVIDHDVKTVCKR